MPRKITAPVSEERIVTKSRIATRAPAHARKRIVAGTPEAFDAVAHRPEIAETAYFLCLARYGQPGSQEEDWLKAEAIVRAKYASRKRAGVVCDDRLQYGPTVDCRRRNAGETR